MVEVKHALVLAVFAEERDILAEIHVLEVICDKAAIATLDALAEFCEEFLIVGHHVLAIADGVSIKPPA